MKHRLYTLPTFFEGEADYLNQLFEEGLPCLHLRKPQQSLQACKNLLTQIQVKHHSKIIVHQHPILIEEFNLLGLHLTETDRRALSTPALQELVEIQHQNKRQIGTSIHKKNDLNTLPKSIDYVTLSPIFSSISKQNHLPTEDWQAKELELPFALVALGGLGIQTLEACYQRGFREVAFLGAVWGDLSNVIQNYQLLCNKMNALMP